MRKILFAVVAALALTAAQASADPTPIIIDVAVADPTPIIIDAQ